MELFLNPNYELLKHLSISYLNIFSLISYLVTLSEFLSETCLKESEIINNYSQFPIFLNIKII